MHAPRGSPAFVSGKVDDQTMVSFRSLCTKPSLQSLRLSNLNFLDETLITEAIRANNLLELSLNNVALGWDDNRVDSNLAPIISQIEKLDIRSVSSRELFRIFGRTNPTAHPFVGFPRLRSLVFSAKCGEFEMQRIWSFILEFRETLETLEIEDVYWPEIIDLQQLTALRNLKILAQADGESDLFLEKAGICYFLSAVTPSSPLRIQSLTIDFSTEISLDSNIDSDIHYWLELDMYLMMGGFVELRRVELNFQFFHCCSASQTLGDWKSETGVAHKRLLPMVSRHPSIEFRLNTRTICTPHSMWAYFSSH
ncbi:hypothetical protein M413DRAFT_26796 [Hebeloma cylindrosporum]|uniref:F-box domain-containing protein n=1 Tax=Hebeloma cylindrosporum TaxID=76867 RepID=A0A0C2YP41_HEBCY|nr:hypothetical protein M413DRAFT_26796 [Hebeloma cylindrosporum h7]